MLVLALLPTLARADAAGDREREARAHWERGNTHYNLAEWAQAITAYKASYRLSRDPRMLYNIAQAHRLASDCQQARAFYKSFLRNDPDSELRPDVEGRIAEMEACLAARPQAPPPGRPGKGLKIAGAVTSAGGVALVAAGVVFGLRARRTYGEIEDRCTSATPCDTDWVSSRTADADGAKRWSIIMYAAGGAAVLGGGILYYVGARRQAAARREVAAVPLPGGGLVVTLAGSF